MGEPATQRTEVRILFDDVALYIGARMFDDLGAAGVRSQLVRRDQHASNSDLLELIFDTFHNHLGQTRFSVRPSGSRSDAGQAAEFADPSWDPVWQVKTVVDSLAPGYNYSTSGRQWVNSVSDETASHFYGMRVVFADLKQKTLSLDTRVNLTFSPTLTFELFAQPFISSVHYTRFKEVAAPRSEQLVVYGEDAGTIQTEQSPAGEVTGYRIDPDAAGPAPVIALANPDFNLRSLRGNAVLRWEYRPGSTLFVVWARTSSDFAQRVGDLDFGRDGGALFSARADNIFLVKVNYWLNR